MHSSISSTPLQWSLLSVSIDPSELLEVLKIHVACCSDGEEGDIWSSSLQGFVDWIPKESELFLIDSPALQPVEWHVHGFCAF